MKREREGGRGLEERQGMKSMSLVRRIVDSFRSLSAGVPFGCRGSWGVDFRYLSNHGVEMICRIENRWTFLRRCLSFKIVFDLYLLNAGFGASIYSFTHELYDYYSDGFILSFSVTSLDIHIHVFEKDKKLKNDDGSGNVQNFCFR